MSGELDRAIVQLRDFVLHRVDQLKRTNEFGYRPSEHAPAQFDALLAEHRMCRSAGVPLRVSSLFNDRTVLGADANLAFRFWHDCTHVALDVGFDHAGEVEVGQEQLRQLETVGQAMPHSLPWRLLFAETIGQTECMRRLGVFPLDQRQFSVEYLRLGLPAAIEREARRRNVLLVSGEQSNVVLLLPRPDRVGLYRQLGGRLDGRASSDRR